MPRATDKKVLPANFTEAVASLTFAGSLPSTSSACISSPSSPTSASQAMSQTPMATLPVVDCGDCELDPIVGFFVLAFAAVVSYELLLLGVVWRFVMTVGIMACGLVTAVMTLAMNAAIHQCRHLVQRVAVWTGPLVAHLARMARVLGIFMQKWLVISLAIVIVCFWSIIVCGKFAFMMLVKWARGLYCATDAIKVHALADGDDDEDDAVHSASMRSCGTASWISCSSSSVPTVCGMPLERICLYQLAATADDADGATLPRIRPFTLVPIMPEPMRKRMPLDHNPDSSLDSLPSSPVAVATSSAEDSVDKTQAKKVKKTKPCIVLTKRRASKS